MRSATITLCAVLVVMPTLTFGQRKPNQGPALCELGFLSAEIQNRLKREFGSWKVQEASDLNPTAYGRWEAEKPLQCPGMVAGEFESAKTHSYAILLVPQEQARSGYRFLVFSPKNGRASYELRIVAQSDEGGAANLFIRRIRISKFFDEQSRRRSNVQAGEGILFLDGAENEYEADIYFWANGSYQHAPIDY